MGRLLLPDLVPLSLNANFGPGVAGSKPSGAGEGGVRGLWGFVEREGEESGKDEGGKARWRGRNGNKIIAKAEMEVSGEALSRLRVGQRFVFNSTVLPRSQNKWRDLFLIVLFCPIQNKWRRKKGGLTIHIRGMAEEVLLHIRDPDI